MTSTNQLLRISGGASIAISALYIALPVLRSVVIAALDQTEDTFTDPDTALARSWEGVYGLVIFGAIGASILILTVATYALTADAKRTPWVQVAALFGVIAGSASLLAGFTSRAMFSTVGASIADTGAARTAQLAAFQSVNITGAALTLALTVCLSVWLVGFATTGRSTGLIGRPTAVVSIIAAAIVLGAQIGFTFFPVQFVFIPLFAGIGISLLLKARRMASVAVSMG